MKTISDAAINETSELARASSHARRPRTDHFSSRAFIAAFLLFEGALILYEFYGDDSPGFGFAVSFFGGPVVLALILAWAIALGSTIICRRWRTFASRLAGPLAAIALCALILKVGISPWRVVFEVARPYYLIEAWTAAPNAQGQKEFEVVLIDKELWSSHETLDVFYANPGPVSAADALRKMGCEGAKSEYSDWTNLGWGFSAEHVFAFCGTR